MPAKGCMAGYGGNDHVRGVHILDTANEVILVIGEPRNGHGVDNLVVHSCRSFFSAHKFMAGVGGICSPHALVITRHFTV